MNRPFTHSRRTALALLLSLSATLVSCLEPTLPLPPPDVPDSIVLSTDSDTEWLVRGHCSPGALVLIKNLDTGHIAGIEDTAATGRYLIRLSATECDEAMVFELIGNTMSPSAYFTVEPSANGIANGDGCAQ